ncbi:hypothetical protein [Arenibacter troitsensis]|uniref:hypothetical protein n=1 Tax=Arenibacter troitsensis TaxID=188872 RepID=UPI00111C51E5|nr:hypothetical protein [Arenibacter troitsensis]
MISLLVQPFDSAQGAATPSPRRKKNDGTIDLEDNVQRYRIRHYDLLVLCGLTNNGTAYFQFRLKSSGFHTGRGKPSIGHFT